MTGGTAVRAEADAGTLFELTGGVTRYWVVRAALEVGLFDALMAGDASTDELAARCRVESRPLAVVCDVLADSGLLRRAAGAWTLSAAARAHLIAAAPEPLGRLLVQGPGRPANLMALASVVRGAPPPQPVDDDDVFWRDMFAATLAPQRGLARAVVTQLGHRPGAVLELGPCAGAWVIELLSADVQARGAVECRPALLGEVVAAAAAAGVEDRLTAAAGDAGRFDMVILANALRVLDVGAARRLIERAVARVAPGGAVVVADYFTDAPGRAGDSARLMAATVVANTRAGGGLRAGDVMAWLATAGCLAARLVEARMGFAVVVAEAPGASS